MNRRPHAQSAGVWLALLLFVCLPVFSAQAADVVKQADEAFARKDFKAAKALYEEAAGQDPTNVRAVHRLALLQSWDGELQTSTDNYRRALALAP
ncbi:MAG TPA: hypothetical protein VKF61_09905, partial [Candidatus Polarisedimenticolia bacterium]|nr:hypothetical protein [Candidatus Polarisedimenticolia bacterium]